ncbi:uncharacterized protein LOC120069552 [Benincasa hispida]|uniref:uncharacterized protein LOC120069552 n=1 Tax=Benincasa hispida TaxID=102211 RepID=UPI0019001AC5|nr:uncharacterized protein LOC120069552 [Benincasa hispida]
MEDESGFRYKSVLDGTYIKVNVSIIDQPRYRTRKEEIATNVLVVCDQNGEFVFVLPGWEGSAVDSRILRDAISRPYGLRDTITYVMLDTPTLKDSWCRTEGNDYHFSPIGVEQETHRQLHENFFNMKTFFSKERYRASVWVAEGRWAILRGNQFYPIQVQCRTITCMLPYSHLMTREIEIGAILDVLDEENFASVGLDGDHIEFVESSEEWTKFMDDLAVEMFTQWQKA